MGYYAVSSRTQWVIEWIHRMAAKFGGIVYDTEAGRSWDWGQALCVERYGRDFSHWPESPSSEDIDRAQRWEAGEWPKWAKPEKKGVA